jgi:hypothetical protein
VLPESMSLPGTQWAKKRGCTCPAPVEGAVGAEYGFWPVMDVKWNCPLHGLKRILEAT